MSNKILALYLPQFHPIKENNIWYGKGFTEWTNVAKAKPLFWGHYQPHVPSELGFYDLRLKETLIEQVNLAKEYGLGGFCFYHYWFGNGYELLETPFKMILSDKNLDFPFCLAWANHKWEKKTWKAGVKNELLVDQKYLGVDDYSMHFYSLLDAFKDSRYIKVDGNILFFVYDPLGSEELSEFVKTWQKLAKENGLKGFYFVGKDFDSRNKVRILEKGFNAIYNDTILKIHSKMGNARKAFLLISRKVLKMPTVFSYKKAAKLMYSIDNDSETTIPLIAPNWDHSPRSGRSSIILNKSKPIYFEQLLIDTILQTQKKPLEKQIILIQAWNEWGEGNHLEPDLRYGRGYLEAIRKAIEITSIDKRR